MSCLYFYRDAMIIGGCDEGWAWFTITVRGEGDGQTLIFLSFFAINEKGQQSSKNRRTSFFVMMPVTRLQRKQSQGER